VIVQPAAGHPRQPIGQRRRDAQRLAGGDHVAQRARRRRAAPRSRADHRQGLQRHHRQKDAFHLLVVDQAQEALGVAPHLLRDHQQLAAGAQGREILLH
jgi:hypothetical protein